MAEIEINAAAAVQWAHNVQRPDGWTYYSQASVVNLARAALRWREERDKEIARNKRLLGDIDALKADQMRRRVMWEEAQARIAELEARNSDLLAEMRRVYAENDAAIKRAEEAEGKLRAMESRMERIRLALLASMSDEQLAEARHE